MKEAVKKQWCDALTSGEYKQGQGYLHHKNGSFCCLGVLADLWAKESESEWEESYSKPIYRMRGVGTTLPEAVAKWAGLFDNPQVSWDNPYVETGEGIKESLAVLNDHGKTFVEIAALIEAQL